VADTLLTPEPDRISNHATRLSGLWLRAFQICAVALGLFILWAAGPGIPEQHTQLVVFTVLTWILTLTLHPERKGAAWRTPRFSSTS
jgi:fatty acid desaturase